MVGIPASLYLFHTCQVCCYLDIIATTWLGDAFSAVVLPAVWYDLASRLGRGRSRWDERLNYSYSVWHNCTLIALLWLGDPAALPGICASFRGILRRLLSLLRRRRRGFIRGVIWGIGAFISVGITLGFL